MSVRKYHLSDLVGYGLVSLQSKFRCRIFSTFWFRVYCRAAGIRLGQGIQVFGRAIVVRYPGTTISIGDNSIFNACFKHLSAGLGFGLKIRTLCRNARIQIGASCELNACALICRTTEIILEDNVLIGAGTIIMDSDFHSLEPRKRIPGQKTAAFENDSPVHIGENVWIGLNVTLLKGVCIGKNSVIAAGSVVTHKIPPNVVAAGIPAKVVKKLT